jgi:hypothetical protein
VTPSLITFDVFGTIVDWRIGMQADLAAAGHSCSNAVFDHIIAAQATTESGSFRTYREITAASLVQVAGLGPAVADRIGHHLGRWPLFPDSRDALRRLRRKSPKEPEGDIGIQRCGLFDSRAFDQPSPCIFACPYFRDLEPCNPSARVAIIDCIPVFSMK